MEIEDRKVWQVAAGDTDRSYHDLCLRWDVMIFGPGYAGPWPECAQGLTRDGWTKRRIGLIRKFCEDVKSGDLVVLRVGTSDIYGVGEVVGEYEWLDDFGDVDGWQLQHVRRVRWLWRYDRKPKSFGTYALKLGDTIQPLDSAPVLKWLGSLEIPPRATARKIVPLPASCSHGSPVPRSSITDIGNYLFDEGVAAAAVDALTDSIVDLQRIASWYDRAEAAPSEAETIAYLVVPLLRTLGWTPQKMAVEWNRVDVALFGRMPRADAHLTVAVEVKKRGRSSLSAKSQAQAYADQANRSGCSRLIVTDGIRYGVYLRSADGNFLETPTAYLNLNRLMPSYPVLECAGAEQALRIMAADWPESP